MIENTEKNTIYLQSFAAFLIISSANRLIFLFTFLCIQPPEGISIGGAGC